MRISRGLDWPIFVAALLTTLIVACCARRAFPSDSDAEIAIQAATLRHNRVAVLPDSLGDVKPPKPTPQDDAPSEISVKVEATGGMVATLREVLGDSGSLILRPTNPVTIKRDAASLMISANTLADYSFSRDKLVLAFPKPKPIAAFQSGEQPTLDAKLWRFTVRPRVNFVELRPDDKATFDVGSGLMHKVQTFDLRPLVETPATTATESRPIMLAWSAPRCNPCQRAKADSSSFPFDIRWDIGEPPAWAANLGRPLFWWAKNGNDPTKQPIGNTVKHFGYENKDDLISRWNTSRRQSATLREYRKQSNASWTVEGGTRSDYIRHLLSDGIHRGKFTRSQLERLSTKELHDLHSDDHAGMINWSSLVNK